MSWVGRSSGDILIPSMIVSGGPNGPIYERDGLLGPEVHHRISLGQACAFTGTS